MKFQKSLVSLPLLCLIHLVGSPSAAGTDLSGVPSLEDSTAEIAYNGPGIPLVMVVPDGSGTPLNQAFDENGNVVDATITMYLRDYAGDPIANFPYEDIWLDTGPGGMNPCIGGANPDDNTDLNGMTSWTAPLEAGGYSDGPVMVMVNGSALTSNSGLALRIKSPDLDGSLYVILGDLTIMAEDYFSGAYHFRCDFNNDGALNLTDVQIMADHYGVLSLIHI